MLRKAHTCVRTLARTHGEGGGGERGWLSGYNFPLFLVYPVDMPDISLAVPSHQMTSCVMHESCIAWLLYEYVLRRFLPHSEEIVFKNLELSLPDFV